LGQGFNGGLDLPPAATENRVAAAISTSSDRAFNLDNVMDTSELMSKRLMTAANSNHALARRPAVKYIG